MYRYCKWSILKTDIHVLNINLSKKKMPFIVLQMASIAFGTFIFLLHSTNVQKKIDNTELDNERFRDELNNAMYEIRELKDEIEYLKIRLSEIKDLASS